MIKVIGDAPRVLYKFMSLPEHVDAICAGRVRLTTIEICRNIEDPGRADRGVWMNWKGRNGGDKPMSQVDFAEFIEKIENDIADVDGFPTSLQMHAMATEFVARQDMALKSTVRLQSGGVNLVYIADPDSGTTEAMKLFEKFAIGIPVFWTVPKVDDSGQQLPIEAYRIDARLKYRLRDGKVTFWYELIRPDRTHQLAALGLIEAIKKGIGTVPPRMGSFS